MKSVVLIFNIQSNTNIGQLIRTANAFGVEEVCIVGRRKYASFGNQGTSSKTKIRHFYKVDDAFSYYQNLSYDFVGIEITDESIPINDKEFECDTVFILGNEGSGIQENILARCQYCVFIPQFGSGASINVNTACGIVLNIFTKNRQDFNKISGYKFESR